ncbi:hypothetical protein BEP19_13435 [Ammoniphilus oxalaticus]|uniref:SIMPL domain-containing protein n=2 Tax=Ammoniphilus oxalaticus TaxID=66863 RepID=A0A419SFC2_9BACL|nr:hypothetical protein BEP19_13435 [Ammoniphilus oxalaticus]
MQNGSKGLVVRVALSLALVGGLAAHFQATPVSAATEVARNTITVAGKGDVLMTPDVAYVQFGLITEGQSAQQAQQKNAELFKEIQAAIKQQGVGEADVKTSRYDTHPDYRWENEQNVLKGYRSEHILEVTYREMDQIGSLLDAVSKAGANRIESVRFGAEKVDEYEMIALQKAVDHARKKADALAKGLGKQVKEVVAIQEFGTVAPLQYRNAMSIAADGEAAMQNSTATTINHGQLTLTSQVQVTFEF